MGFEPPDSVEITVPTFTPVPANTGLYEYYVGEGEKRMLNEVECAYYTEQVTKKADEWWHKAADVLAAVEDDGKQSRMKVCMDRVHSDVGNDQRDLGMKRMYEECRNIE